MTQKTVLLASKSPRRFELLSNLGYNVIVISSNNHTRLAFEGDETQHPGEAAQDYVVRTAKQKFFEGLAKLEGTQLPQAPVVAADTVVIFNNEILGKPVDEADATRMLRALSGHVHEVRTAVFVGNNQKDVQSMVSVSKVLFKALSDEEIAAYIATKDPFDKAGGYGIQGLAGTFISSIQGSYTGIMGLPIFEVSELLKKAGCPAL